MYDQDTLNNELQYFIDRVKIYGDIPDKTQLLSILETLALINQRAIEAITANHNSEVDDAEMKGFNEGKERMWEVMELATESIEDDAEAFKAACKAMREAL